MNCHSLLYICALAALIALGPNVGAQSDDPGGLPVNTSYRDFRLETVHINLDGDPGAVSVPAATAVPEPNSWALLALGGAVMALAGIRRSPLRGRFFKN